MNQDILINTTTAETRVAVLENRRIDGSSALDIFLPKIHEDDALLRSKLKQAVAIPSKSILFNIDQKATLISKDQTDALLRVFVKVFDEARGYYGDQGHIARFERQLDDEGQLGVAVVDFGGATTTVAVFADGHPIYCDALAIGGDDAGTGARAIGNSTVAIGGEADAFGPGRPAAVCRELTKLHEEVARGGLGDLAGHPEGDLLLRPRIVAGEELGRVVVGQPIAAGVPDRADDRGVAVDDGGDEGAGGVG